MSPTPCINIVVELNLRESFHNRVSGKRQSPALKLKIALHCFSVPELHCANTSRLNKILMSDTVHAQPLEMETGKFHCTYMQNLQRCRSTNTYKFTLILWIWDGPPSLLQNCYYLKFTRSEWYCGLFPTNYARLHRGYRSLFISDKMASEVQTEQPRPQPTKLLAAVNPIREVNICKHNLMSLHSSTSMVPTFHPFVGPLKSTSANVLLNTIWQGLLCQHIKY